MSSPYLMIVSPSERSLSATLWPIGISALAVRRKSELSSVQTQSMSVPEVRPSTTTTPTLSALSWTRRWGWMFAVMGRLSPFRGWRGSGPGEARERVVKCRRYLDMSRPRGGFGEAAGTGQARAVLRLDGREHGLRALGEARRETARVEHENEMRKPRRIARVIEERTGLVGVVRAREPRREKLDHERQRRPLRATRRDHRAGHGGGGIGGGPPLGVERPAVGNGGAGLLRQHHLAARDMAEREVDEERIALRPRGGEGDGVRAVERAVAAPGGHRCGRIRQRERDHPRPCEWLDGMARDPEMMRPGYGDCRQAELAGHGACGLRARLDGGEGEPVSGIDPDDRPVADNLGLRPGSHLPGPHLRGIKRRTREAMGRQPVPLRRDERPGGRCREAFGHAGAAERGGHEGFRVFRRDPDRGHDFSDAAWHGNRRFTSL